MDNKENPFSFSTTVTRIKQLFKNDEMNIVTKYNAINQMIRKYYDSEDIKDVFEGFLRFVVLFHDFASSLTDRADNSLAVQCVQVFKQFTDQSDLSQREIIHSSMPEDKSVYVKALKVASSFKQKHTPLIEQVFRLKHTNNLDVLIKLVKHIMRRDLPKAVEWINDFDLRDAFESYFNEIVCQLFLLNQPVLLEAFIGESRERKLKLLSYLDELMSLELRKFAGRTESEELVLAEVKRLEKMVTKYMKLYDVHESHALNVMNFRMRNALLFHHHRWASDEMTLLNFEEIALHAMRESEFIERFYLEYLCDQKRYSNAMYFAFRLGVNKEKFPRKLAEFAKANPDDCENTRIQAMNNKREKEKALKETNYVDCKLFDGFPVYLVTDWHGICSVMKVLEDEQVIGIDTEWKPHYTNFKEQVALIQIACSKAVFLVDVVVLEMRLSNDQWTKFFTALLCSDDCRKIGFDFGNDLRVLKSTFPFLSSIAPNVKHIICLYRLLQQVILTPEAEQLVFPDGNRLSNIRLYDVANHFMNIELDKSEQNSNWMERPMRHEKKVYAALDAYCLIGCFKIIADRLMGLESSQILKQLQMGSMVNFVEAKNPTKAKKVRNPETGEYEIVGGSSRQKENDNEFIASILKVTDEIESRAAANSEIKLKLKSVDDFRFAVDSMFFGLGQCLRKCGFETEMIRDHDQLIRFCLEKPTFTAISTGKGFKKLELDLPAERAFCLPMNTNDPKANSQLIAYIMRNLNIVIHSKSMRSRCVKCGKRAFVLIPRLIVKAIFYLIAVEKEFDFLEISAEDLSALFRELVNHAKPDDIVRTREDLSSDEEFTVNVHDNQITCRCKHCSIDIMNRLLLLAGDDSLPMEINGTMSIRKEALDDLDSRYYVCTCCGKIQYTWPNQQRTESSDSQLIDDVERLKISENG